MTGGKALKLNASAPAAVWTSRVSRAGDLSEDQSPSAPLLRFYSGVLQVQSAIALDVATRLPEFRPELPFRQQLDVDTPLRHIDSFADLVIGQGPTLLASQMQEIRARGNEYIRELLEWSKVADSSKRLVTPAERFTAMALLQPAAEILSRVYPAPPDATGRCPVCGSTPQLAVLTQEGEGAKRSLQCHFCLTIWEYRRVLCPWCGESDREKLPRYSAQELPHVRVEACDTCQHYLKSIDMTVDGRAVPLVDEIAATALDVWAGEQGYVKITPNLLGF